VEERRTERRRQEDRDFAKLHGKQVEHKQEKRSVRRAIRHSCKAVLTIEFRHQADGNGDWIEKREDVNARVLDLSEDGAAFFIKHPATASQVFPFRINVFDGSHIEGEAEIRWVRQKESAKGYTIGAQFSAIDSTNQDRVDTFLRELDSTLGMVEGQDA
jgi:hypothetical protein